MDISSLEILLLGTRLFSDVNLKGLFCEFDHLLQCLDLELGIGQFLLQSYDPGIFFIFGIFAALAQSLCNFRWGSVPPPIVKIANIGCFYSIGLGYFCIVGARGIEDIQKNRYYTAIPGI